MKKFGKLSERQLKEVSADLYMANQGRSELLHLARGDHEKSLEAVSRLKNIQLYYQLPPVVLIALIFHLTGNESVSGKWHLAGDPQQAALDFMHGSEFEASVEKLPVETQHEVASMEDKSGDTLKIGRLEIGRNSLI